MGVNKFWFLAPGNSIFRGNFYQIAVWIHMTASFFFKDFPVRSPSKCKDESIVLFLNNGREGGIKFRIFINYDIFYFFNGKMGAVSPFFDKSEAKDGGCETQEKTKNNNIEYANH